ncbi:hypothetical protein KQE47_23540, partial [Raoultella planticola]|uniref:hypothetical protein n=1 Tax=Raoultella planticola TaxID=575 RepID=UPI00223A89B4
KACVLPENPASYRVVRKKSYLFNKARNTLNKYSPSLIIYLNVLNKASRPTCQSSDFRFN